MAVALAALAGYLAGSLPSADWVGRVVGLDLRRSGTRNPGTANAIGLGGFRVGLVVLAIDFAKGAAAVGAGRLLAGGGGGLVAGVAAVAAQIANPWYGFRGGKGLGVTGGVALAGWPVAFPVLAPLLVLASRVLRSSARGVVATLVAMVPVAAAWAVAGWPTWWGVRPGPGLLWFAAALAALLAPKFVRDAVREGRTRSPRTDPARRS